MHLYFTLYWAGLTLAQILGAMRLLLEALLPLLFGPFAMALVGEGCLFCRLARRRDAQTPGSYLRVLLSVKKRE